MAKAQPTPKHLPTSGNCYQLAFEALQAFPECKLIHGRPTLQRPPYCQHGHAWLEQGDMVKDPSYGIIWPKNKYYALGKIDAKLNCEYSFELAIEMVLTHEHYGPWEGPDAEE